MSVTLYPDGANADQSDKNGQAAADEGTIISRRPGIALLPPLSTTAWTPRRPSDREAAAVGHAAIRAGAASIVGWTNLRAAPSGGWTNVRATWLSYSSRPVVSSSSCKGEGSSGSEL